MTNQMAKRSKSAYITTGSNCRPPTRNQKWFDAQCRPNQVSLMTWWFSIIEFGWIEFKWSTFPQRLEYVRLQADLTNDSWRKSAKVPKATFSRYLNDGSDCADRIDSCHHIYNLLKVARQDIELPWVLNGSGLWPHSEQQSFNARCIWAFEVVGGPGGIWTEVAKFYGLDPKDFTKPSDDSQNHQIANKVCSSIGPSFSSSWLLTGMASPPKSVLQHIEILRRDGRLYTWQEFMSEPVMGDLTMSELISVTEVIEAHLKELPDSTSEGIRMKLAQPLIDRPYMTAMKSLVRKKGYWTEERIKNSWVSILLMAPPVLEWWRQEAPEEFNIIQSGTDKVVGYKPSHDVTIIQASNLVKKIRRQIQKDILKHPFSSNPKAKRRGGAVPNPKRDL